MTRRETAFCLAMLIVLGAAWGMTMPLTKIAVSTGYKHFGLLFWQMAIGVVVMSAIALLRGTRLPLGMPQVRIYVLIALIGSVLPNTASYQAAVHLPSGVMSILLSMIPIWAFPIALLATLWWASGGHGCGVADRVAEGGYVRLHSTVLGTDWDDFRPVLRV
jgi:drug/metabolite transporter (DMT)-like permease